ncbi:hypothetical protein A3A38_04160 [Candidatus Kaiserbacteria bacterium RIFCSPLOWO2_01_FULL_53_17]|uniref:PIN domain-containing protein n=1 Tax=Candidatus Kaiserbacteria bacterium RIFCSPLOWO2_01_FULL_53_17 TaxID=1798511 RepID=A0A1F6EFU7_9BACT|nr:MAG: hypothetical protein A3A38_04160 [Candidatus Kaiserbacteria bacterium RIFCSPLOWO2_01_FULL_53_17]
MALVGLDTSLFIYLLEDHPSYAPKAARIFDALRKGKHVGLFSALGMIEILTGPKKQGRDDLAAQYEHHLRHFPNLSIVGLNERIVWIASDLRAKYGIKTPDAIHLATSIDAGARTFITNDKSLRKVKEIRVVLL